MLKLTQAIINYKHPTLEDISNKQKKYIQSTLNVYFYRHSLNLGILVCCLKILYMHQVNNTAAISLQTHLSVSKVLPF